MKTERQQQILEVKVFVPVGYWAREFRPVKQGELYMNLAGGEPTVWHRQSPSVLSYFILEKEIDRD